MIKGRDIVDVIGAIVPLYITMILAYFSVKFWKIFTPDQCSGISSFVRTFSIPLLSFKIISSNNLYTVNLRLFFADTLQKLLLLSSLFLWQTVCRRSSTTGLDWTITFFSLSSLPNTLIIGVPLLKSMYGVESANLIVQTVVFQSVIWITVMLVLLEYRGAKLLVTERFRDNAGDIASFSVDSDVVSLNGIDSLQVDSCNDQDGKFHVVVRKSVKNDNFSNRTSSMIGTATPRVSNLTGAEIYSVRSSLDRRLSSSRCSSFNLADFCLCENNLGAYYTPRISTVDHEEMVKFGKKRSKDGLVVPISKDLVHMFAWNISNDNNNINNNMASSSTTDFGVKIDSSNKSPAPVDQDEVTSSKG